MPAHSRVAGSLVLVFATLPWLAAIGAVPPPSALWTPTSPDEWTAFMQAGDAGATGGEARLANGEALPARAAYLLAFHHAQDRGDLARMLVAAERLERLGERPLAEYARRAARELAREAGETLTGRQR